MPQLIAETQFLGPSYMALRLALTLLAVILVGQVMEKLIQQGDLPKIGLK